MLLDPDGKSFLVRLNEQDIKPPPKPRPTEKKKLVVPPYVRAALKTRPKALAAFDNFSYSHKKEYVEWITEAKTDATRQKRLATMLKWLAQGKSRHWKYQNC